MSGLAGCGGGSGVDTPTRTPTPASTAVSTDGTPPPDRTPTDEGTPARESRSWEPAWQRTVAERALGLDPFGGTLYAAVEDGPESSAVVALVPEDGTVRWRAPLDGEVVKEGYVRYNEGGDLWGVTPTDATVYAATGRVAPGGWGAVHALDRETGDIRWSHREAGRRVVVRGVADGTVLVGSAEVPSPPETTHSTPKPTPGEVRGLAATDGAEQWSVRFDPLDRVWPGAGAVYALSGTAVVALESDGIERWRYDAGHEVRAVRDAGNRTYHVTDDPTVVRGIDRTGHVAWARQLSVLSTLVGPDDRLFVGGDATLALDPGGTVVWRDPASSNPGYVGPANDTLYVDASGGAVGAYALPTGRSLWTFDPPERHVRPVTATRGMVAVQALTDEERRLYAVDRETGTMRQWYDVGRGIAVFAAESLDGRVFVAENGTVTAFDA